MQKSRLTRVDVEVGEVQDLETFARRLLGRRKRIGLRLREPAGEVQRCRRRERAQARDEVLAQHLF